jgi:WD40 repeat protein/tRNA A-37 threonylcarbamoyl transferase component Bud32
MFYCLNPDCAKPLNHDGMVFCQNCGIKLLPLLRNRYRIIRPLGEGGFGITFLAEDVDNLQEHCVVKQLAPKVKGSSNLRKATELFAQEAQRLKQLGKLNPQIPTLHAYFEEDNCLYLVQQYIEGQNLRQEFDEQGLFSEEKIWQILNDLLPVLKFVHEHQVIHRDIKPENIIRRQSDGCMVLIDFGASKQLTAAVQTTPGTVIGTVGYSPLEQIKYGEAFPASDLFSLGATCFHLLTGINPSGLYLDQGYAWITNWQKHCKSSISQKLYQVLENLLQKETSDRYQSADEVIEYLTSQPPDSSDITQLPSFLSSPTTVKIRRLPKKTFGLGIISLSVLAGGLWIASQLISPSSLTLEGHLNQVNSVAFSRDGNTIVSGSDDMTIRIWNMKAAKEIRILNGHTKWIYSVAISPDGKTIVSGSQDKTIKIWKLNTGEEIRTLTGHTDYVNAVAISSQGNTIVSGSYDKTIKVWNLNTGKLIRTIEGNSSRILSVAISPDGQTIVSGDNNKTIKEWNINTGQLIRTINGHKGDVNALAISPNSQLLVSASDDKTIKFWNLNTGQLIHTLKGHADKVYALSISPDVQKIASASQDTTVKIWNLSTKQEIRTLKGDGEVFAVAFSPDSKTVISGSGDKTVKVWRLE